MTNAHARAPTRAQLLNRVGGLAQGTYRLVGVLMYARGYHFVADVLDVCERRWLRYDGMVGWWRMGSGSRLSRQVVR